MLKHANDLGSSGLHKPAPLLNMDEASVWHLEAPPLFSKSTLLLISHDRNNQTPIKLPSLSLLRYPARGPGDERSLAG